LQPAAAAALRVMCIPARGSADAPAAAMLCQAASPRRPRVHHGYHAALEVDVRAQAVQADPRTLPKLADRRRHADAGERGVRRSTANFAGVQLVASLGDARTKVREFAEAAHRQGSATPRELATKMS